MSGEQVRTASGTPARPGRADLYLAIGLGTRAPSIHNSQPWLWRLVDDGFDLYADPERRLSAADPDGHGQLISCGAALELAILGLRGSGWLTTVERLPSPTDPTFLARVRTTTYSPPDQAVIDRMAAAQRRRSERRPFADRPVGTELLDQLEAAVAQEGVFLHMVSKPDEALNLAVVVSQADRAQRRDADYRTELAQWTRPDEVTADGVPPTAVPHLSGAVRHADIPLRDFEVSTTGRLPIGIGTDEHPIIAVIMTDIGGSLAALRAGEAMARLMVEAERLGLASSAVSQAVDWPVLRQRMRDLLSWQAEPQMVVRVGWKPAGAAPGPTNRRPVAEVLC
ncbi:MAG: hypothetical protein WCB04_13510 [Mycobacteriales bacterium]